MSTEHFISFFCIGVPLGAGMFAGGLIIYLVQMSLSHLLARAIIARIRFRKRGKS